MARVTTFGERVRPTGVTRERLQEAWDEAVKKMDVIEKREDLLRKQCQWLSENATSDDYGAAMKQHQVRVDEWYDVILEDYYKGCAAFDRLVKRCSDVAVLRSIHPYAEHGFGGLEELRGDRAKGRVPWKMEFATPTNEAPFGWVFIGLGIAMMLSECNLSLIG